MERVHLETLEMARRHKNGNNDNQSSITTPTKSPKGKPKLERVTTVEKLKIIQSEATREDLDLWKRMDSGNDNDSSSVGALKEINSTSSDDYDTDDSASSSDKDQQRPLTGAAHKKINNQVDNDTSNEITCPKKIALEKFMASRMMTPMQERMNAITMIPPAAFMIYVCLTGYWLKDSDLDEIRSVSTDFSDASCLDRNQWCSWFLPQAGIPPLPILFLAFGQLAHAPCSFIYHWKCAALPPGVARTNHWTRRLDQAMIHVGSTFWCFSTSGSWQYFFVNLLYNIDCCFKQFEHEVRPKRNQARVGLAIVGYILPVLISLKDVLLFAKMMFIISLSSYLFILYPAGGWSHSIFHVVMFFLPICMIEAAVQLPQSQEVIWNAAKCVVLQEQQVS